MVESTWMILTVTAATPCKRGHSGSIWQCISVDIEAEAGYWFVCVFAKQSYPPQSRPLLVGLHAPEVMLLELCFLVRWTSFYQLERVNVETERENKQKNTTVHHQIVSVQQEECKIPSWELTTSCKYAVTCLLLAEIWPIRLQQAPSLVSYGHTLQLRGNETIRGGAQTAEFTEFIHK